jgi:hypothetical protein
MFPVSVNCGKSPFERFKTPFAGSERQFGKRKVATLQASATVSLTFELKAIQPHVHPVQAAVLHRYRFNGEDNDR